MSFIRRMIDITFTLGTGSFGEGGANQVKISGLRVSATIVKAGLSSMPLAQLRIYGLTLSLMNQLSTLGVPQATAVQRNNSVTVSAGDEDGQMAVVFTGTIQVAWADLRNAPDTPFIVYAFTGLFEKMKPVAATSYKGTVAVATIVQSIAVGAKFNFENNGVTSVLSNPYFAGTAWQQLQRCIDAAGIEWNGGDGGVVAIWPKGRTRGGTTPLISPDNGLVGYPSYSDFGPYLTVTFTPSIIFGGKVKVQSSITPACGTWWVMALTHELESETPGGAWFTNLTCSWFDLTGAS